MAKSRSYGGLIVTFLIVGALGAGAWYYFRGTADKQPEFNVTKVVRGDIIQTVTATGDLQPVITVDVSSQISGQIKEVLVDFNTPVKAGDVLARIDPSTQEQAVRQSTADLASAEANTQLVRINTKRTRDLATKNLVSQQELDAAEAQLSQAESTLLTRTAALENAKVNLARCTIYAPIDGMVLNRLTDKGRTVSASTSAPTLFTLVNDLAKMQINASVAEADIGTIAQGQDVTFTVDAFPTGNFHGTVRQVRNAASVASNVVSYATIIDVNNKDLKLKPGMTANVSIIVSQRTNVLRVANSALRVRLPAELLPKPPAVAGATATTGSPTAMSDDEKRKATSEVLREAGFQMGTPITPEITEKAKLLAKDKGLDPEAITQFVTRMANRAAGGGGRRGGGAGGDAAPVVVSRSVYKLANPDAKEKSIVAVNAKLGISDGFHTEVLDGLAEGDALVTSVVMPGSVAPVLQAPAAGGAQNPFQGNRGGGGGGGRRGGG